MSDERIGNLEGAIANLADKFSEFLAIESARKERDKHQMEVNDRLIAHFEKVEADYKPIIMRSKKQQAWIDFFVGKVVLPVIALAVLAAAGYSFK
tara:strand:- start:46 stop:330 length:285 start_codon:yes stop_codon:yes gene_type:complete